MQLGRQEQPRRRHRRRLGFTVECLWFGLATTAAACLLLLLLSGTTFRADDVVVDRGFGNDDAKVAYEKEEEAALTMEAVAADTSLLANTRRRELQNNNNDDDDVWLYSKFATIVPDPEYHATDQEKEDLKNEWGSWHFWDGTEDERPAGGDYCAKYPYRDMPDDDFTDDMWQADAVYVNHILDSGDELIQRAQEAIYVEYGHERHPPVAELLERNKMFRWEMLDLSGASVKPSLDSRERGGWTTRRSSDGLTRRILHAMMTNDEFVVVVVGGAAAAGDGNHFRQSYTMQMHRVVAPVLARLGVKLVTHNLSHRRGGSLPTALAKVWGQNKGVDLLIWDEGRFEHGRREKDLFLRQALLSGQEKIPAVWMGGTESDLELLRMYHEKADIDVGRFGTAMYGIPKTTEENVESLPHAARYLRCEQSAMGLCRPSPNAYCASCWIDRPDIPDPKKLFPNITDQVPDQRSWNPGWRKQQLTGRLLAASLLDSIQDAVQIFTSGTLQGPPLDSHDWHVGEYYQNMREKLANVSPQDTGCAGWGELLPSRVCSLPFHGATQYTPRVGPSITDLIKAGPNGKPLNPQKVLYEGHDVHNTCFDPQGGTLNVVGVVSARRQLLDRSNKYNYNNEDGLYEEDDLLKQMPPPAARVHAARMANAYKKKQSEQSQHRHHRSLGSLETGTWHVVDELPGQCDGQYTSYNCGRQSSSTCPLLGHHDSQGQVQGDESSGWLVLELEKLEKGVVIIGVRLPSPTLAQKRRLGRGDPLSSLPDSFALDVSIDGKVSTWNKAQFSQHYRHQLQRGFDAVVLLDDDAFSTSSETVEVGLRVHECSGSCAFGVTHVFWA